MLLDPNLSSEDFSFMSSYKLEVIKLLGKKRVSDDDGFFIFLFLQDFSLIQKRGIGFFLVLWTLLSEFRGVKPNHFRLCSRNHGNKKIFVVCMLNSL